MNKNEEELKNYYISEDMVLNIIQSPKNGDLYLMCDIYDNGEFYFIGFKLCENKLEIKHVEASYKDIKGINYDDIVNNIRFYDNKVEITIDSVYEFDEEHIIKLNFDKIFSLENVPNNKNNILDKIGDKFFIRDIKDLIERKSIYGSYEIEPKYINGILKYFNEILKREESVSYQQEKIKLDVEESIKMAQEFLDEMNIPININDLLTNQSLSFKTENFDKKSSGESSYDKENNKKILSVNKTDDLTMAVVLVHELFHYYNQPDDNNRTMASDFLTEVVSYGFELIFLEKYLESIYKKDAQDMMKMVSNMLTNTTNCLYGPMISLKFYKNQELTVEGISKNLRLESYIKNMKRFIAEKRKISNELWTIIGLHLAIYCYIEYKKDPSFINKLLEFNNSINTKSIMECLQIIGLNDIREVFDKGMTNLDEYIGLVKSYQEEKNVTKTLTLK